jgi:electron transport complex protein RnfB
MTEERYQRLAHHLDTLPGGFPKTETGVEIRILKHLFSPLEAALAIHLTLVPEPARVMAKRAGIPVAEAADRLAEMGRKGLIIALPGSYDTTPLYLANQYVIGIWEFAVDRLSPELIAEMHEYIPALFDRKTWQQAPQLRTIPVGKSLSPKNPILPYDAAEAIVSERKRFHLAPCICRREKRIMGKGCDRPELSCLIFDRGAELFTHMGIGRSAERSEVLELLKMAEAQAMVLQPGNSREPGNICLCCKCCCGVLNIVSQDPHPSQLTGSGYQARWDESACTHCGTCLKRCPMEALHAQNGKIAFDPLRCIGCGLCVTTCPAKALSMEVKPAGQRPKVPRNSMIAAIDLARIRGQLGPARIAATILRSGWDRLTAPRR